MQFLKVWWMGFWRTYLAFAFLADKQFMLPVFLSMVFAAVLVFGTRNTIGTFPLLRLLRHKPVMIPLDSSESSRSSQMDASVISSADVTAKEETDFTSVDVTGAMSKQVRVDRSSNKGVMTGFEPQILDTMEPATSFLMVGKPGESIADSDRISDRNRNVGTKGEVNFAKALKKTGVLDKFYTFWSVPMPSSTDLSKKDSRLKTDIDCIILSDQIMFLIDVKMYKSGDVTYHVQDGKLVAVDNATGAIVGNDYTMSKNMMIAADRFSKNFQSRIKVVPMVVLMPNSDGEAQIAPGTMWNGDISVKNLTQALMMIKSQPSTSVSENMLRPLRALKR